MEKTKELDERSGGIRETLKRILNNISLVRFAAFLIILKIVDVVSTYYALVSIEEAIELNPFLDWMFSNIGLESTLLLILLIYTAIILRIYWAKNISKYGFLKINKHKIYAVIAVVMIYGNLNNIIKIVITYE